MSGAPRNHSGAGLSPTHKRLLAGVLTALLGIQLFHTAVLQHSNWPFADHSFFKHVTPLQQEVMKVHLIEDTGRRVTGDPWNVVPMDYWLAMDLMHRIYLPDGDLTGVRERFSPLILQWVNGEPWRDFDEFALPLRPAPGARFVGFELTADTLDYTLYQYGSPLEPLKSVPFYSYSEPRPQ